MFVKTARYTLLWMLALLCACSMAGATDAQLPPLDAAYIDVDPAAQRVVPLDAEDAAARSGLEALLRREPRNALARLQFAQLQLDRGLRARVARELDSAERFSEPGSELRRRVHFNAGWILFRERLSASRILAMAMGFAGLAAVLGVKDGIPLPRNWGDALALLSGMCWAAGTIRSFRRPTRRIALPVFGFALGGFVSSAVILAIAAVVAPALAWRYYTASRPA